jgi:hypothetical protein
MADCNQDVFRVARAHQALFAHVDTLTKTLADLHAGNHPPTRDLKPRRAPKNVING